MAQKTPLPAKTVTYADRWNATWFVDLSQFQKKLQEDYHLRFLVTCFLRIKRYWLYRFSLNYSNGLYFLQLAVVMSQDKIIVKPALFPTQTRQNVLKKTWVPLFKKVSGTARFLQGQDVNTWEKRLTATQEATWLALSEMGYRNHNMLTWAAQHRQAVSRGKIFHTGLAKGYLTISQTLNLTDRLVLLQQAAPELLAFWYSQMYQDSLTSLLCVLTEANLEVPTELTIRKMERFNKQLDFYDYMVFWPRNLICLGRHNAYTLSLARGK